MALVDPTPSVRLRRPHVALALLLAMVLPALLPSVAEARSVARVRWVAVAADGVPSTVAVRWQRVSATKYVVRWSTSPSMARARQVVSYRPEGTVLGSTSAPRVYVKVRAVK